MTAAPTTAPIHIQHNPVLQNVLAYGAETYVPDHDICRLSYYLKCCTIGCGCGIDIFANLPLVDYQVAHLLPETLQEIIIRLTMEVFKLDSLLNKAFILDENHVLLPLGTLNTFYKFELASNFFSIDPITVVAGQRVEIHKVMLCTAKWMREYYILPLIRYQQRQRPPFGPASSITAPITEARLLQGYTQPQASPLASSSYAAINSSTTNSSSSCRTSHHEPATQTSSPSCCAACQRPMGHQCELLCETSYNYRCMDCPGDVRLCESCYLAGEHHDQTHAFAQLRHDGSHRPEMLGAQVQALSCSSEGNDCSALLPDLPLAIAVPVFDQGTTNTSSSNNNNNNNNNNSCANGGRGPTNNGGNEDTPMARAEVA